MFVVCGEALMDVYPGERTPDGLRLEARVGGSPFNVALGLARLKQPVQFLGGISLDAPGERLMQALHDEGVGTALVMRSGAPTTLSLVSVDAAGVPRYAFHGHAAADRLPDAAALPPLPDDARVLHFGSYAMVVEPVGPLLRALAGRERGRRLLACDVNVRLNVEPRVQRWREVAQAMAGVAHVMKASDEDLALLHPDEPPAQVAARWLQAGARLVVVTRGAQGSAAWSHRGHAAVPAQPVAVADTVGAGDSFQAALLCWLAEHDALSPGRLDALDGDAMAALLRFGTRAAARVCARRGADMPRRGELG